MQFVTDLHLHSKYSRAVSPNMILSTMAQYASQKGLDILTASDWTHPLWLKEIRNQLVERDEGLYQINEGTDEMKKIRFLLSTEISSIYKQGEKLRRIHSLVFAPDFSTAEKINQELLKRRCNLMADGRPIIGLSSKQLLELILSIDERCLIIPCHVWTPHFGVYGSASGFDSLEEAFGELAKFVYGIETGLSSDPEMNWQMPELKNRSILSFSDAHSPAKMGREATVMELAAPSYENIRSAIMEKSMQSSGLSSQLSDKGQSVSRSTGKPKTGRHTTENRQLKTDNRIVYTIEFYPEEGKYHFSGHRNCKVAFGPEEITKSGNICPVCHRLLTEGVLYRVQALAGTYDIKAQEKPNDYGLKWYVDGTGQQAPYVKLVPLLEIVAESMGSTVSSMKTNNMYTRLCKELGSEIQVLLKTPLTEIAGIGGNRIADGVERVRRGAITIIPGYDGEYGIVKIWKEGDVAKDTDETPQMSLDL